MLPQPSGCGDLYHSNPAEYLLRTNPIQRRDHPGAAILSQQFIKNDPIQCHNHPGTAIFIMVTLSNIY